MKSYITRKKSGKKFQYFRGDVQIKDSEEIERINKLAIPPAWQNVEIAISPRSKIQARGHDAAGRLQSIYSPSYRMKQEKKKFDRILRFADQLPSLRKQLAKDLKRKRLGKEKVLACVVTLIDEAYFRVGNEKYASEHQTYGITTLRSKHANITNTTVTFDFVGKSGMKHIKKIEDKQIARIVKQLDELPGYEIFRYQDKQGHMHDLHAHDVNQYIKEHMGEEFTAKDFRTWGGTLYAASLLLERFIDENETSTARKKAITQIVKSVAKKLGNTPAVARSSYIDPRVLAAANESKNILKLQRTMKNMRPKKYRSVEEQSVLALLSA